MGEGSTRQDIEAEAKWIESTLTTILNRHAPQISLTARSKRWWTPEVDVKCNEYGRTRRLYQQGSINTFALRMERNSYYYTI